MSRNYTHPDPSAPVAGRSPWRSLLSSRSRSPRPSLTLAPRASAEPPAGGNGAAGCEYGGDTYNTGDRIVVFSGAHYDIYYCAADGTWVKVEQVVKPVPVKLPPATYEHFAAKRNR